MQKSPTLLTWLFKAPLRFALILFFCTTLILLGYFLIHGIQSPASQTSVYTILTIAFIVSIYLTIRKLPNIKMDKASFIAIHNAQTILLFLLFSISTYFLITRQQEILLKLMTSDTTILFLLILTALYFSFLFGTAIINFYIKIRRIQQFNIPNWKIICSLPFGFGMLWTPGYLLDTKNIKNPAQPIKSKWYSKLTNWTLSNQINTISMFVFMTIISGFFVGLATTLLTLTLAIIFGLWVMHNGTKIFEKNMHKKYATTAVIINIIMIITFSCIYIYAPKQNISINISETIATTQGQ